MFYSIENAKIKYGWLYNLFKNLLLGSNIVGNAKIRYAGNFNLFKMLN